MNKNYVFVFLLAAASGSLAFVHSSNYNEVQTQYKKSHLMSGSGSDAGRTGAPGESNCTACHAGSTQSGSGINTVVMTEGLNPVTSYTPGTTYNIGVSFTSSSAKNGFQIVALNSSNAQAGTITIIPSTGTQVITGSAGKKYVTHTSAGNQQSSWAFQWTAPSTNVGNVIFYLATNETNQSQSASGDIIRLSQHIFGSQAGIDEKTTGMELQVAYLSDNNSLSLNYNSLKAGESRINLTDLSGKSVFEETIGNTEIGENTKTVKLPASMKGGIYIVHLNVNNTFTSKKIYIL